MKKAYGGMDVVGVVMGLFDEAFDFLLIKYGIVKRVYLKVFLNKFIILIFSEIF
jgi:hypothetical protein